MGEVRLSVDFDDEYLLYYPSITTSEEEEEIVFCRICHEAEFESSKAMESPCSCSGTVKFAHRDCVQRWCHEKGNTSCEICLQKFQPGYSSPVQFHRVVTLDVPETEVNSAIVAQQERIQETEYYPPQCSSAADTSASVCRFLGLAITVILLVRDLSISLIQGTGDYPFTLLTLLVIRVCGIIIPMYIIMRAVDAVRNSIIQRRYQVSWQTETVYT